MKTLVGVAVGLLACLGSAALSSALADPPTEAPSAAPSKEAAPAAPATPDPTGTQAEAAKKAAVEEAAAKATLERDTQHFLAEGFRPEMRGGEQIYCRKEKALGSRLTLVKNCGTIEELRLAEQRIKAGVYDAQRQQTNPTFH